MRLAEALRLYERVDDESLSLEMMKFKNRERENALLYGNGEDEKIMKEIVDYHIALFKKVTVDEGIPPIRAEFFAGMLMDRLRFTRESEEVYFSIVNGERPKGKTGKEETPLHEEILLYALDEILHAVEELFPDFRHELV